MTIKQGKKAIGSVSYWSKDKDLAFARDIDFLLALKLRQKKAVLSIDDLPFRISDVKGKPFTLITLQRLAVRDHK